MLSFLLSPKSTITHPAYDFDHQGNRVQSGTEALIAANVPIPSLSEKEDSLYPYELGDQLESLGKGWVDLHESIGSTKLMVKINVRTYQTFTYYKGDVSLVSCGNAMKFTSRVAYEREFYKLRTEDYTLIQEGGHPRIFDHRRKIFIV